MFTRRTMFFAAGAFFIVPAAAFAQTDGDVARLLRSGPMPEKSLGDPGAPITIVQYASLTCHHCMNFHMETWPALKAKYVDTGKVRFVIREFPLDPLATGGFMLARCAEGDKWYPMIDMLYRQQEGWAHAKNPADALLQLVRQAGFTKESFESCLSDEALLRNVKQVAERGSKEFGVESTPTFFINGKKYVGAMKIDEFDKILAPLLAGQR